MAEHHMPDVFSVDLGARQRFTDRGGGQLGRGNILQAAAIGTDGGAHTADNNDFATHSDLLM